MNEEFEMDIITLIDDDDNEHEFEVIDEIDIEDGHFLALVPTQPGELTEPDTYYVFEIVDEDGEEQLMEVEDEDLLNKVSDIFESRFEEEFYDETEEE